MPNRLPDMMDDVVVQAHVVLAQHVLVDFAVCVLVSREAGDAHAGHAEGTGEVPDDLLSSVPVGGEVLWVGGVVVEDVAEIFDLAVCQLVVVCAGIVQSGERCGRHDGLLYLLVRLSV